MAISNYNQGIIEEFRANGGKVGGRWEGRKLLLLTTTGAKTGREHTTPVAYLQDGETPVVFASKGGSPEHPQWYRNLVKNPHVTVEVGTDRYEAIAEPVSGPERDELYRRQVEVSPTFGDYEEKTRGIRQIPVVRLRRV